MQIELTLTAPAGADYLASDLGFLLHKHPAHLHERATAWGPAYLFFSEAGAERSTAVLYLKVDPVALVRGRNQNADGLLAQYVNDRPYSASSFLSVAIGKSLGQSLAGKSKDRQHLAERELPFEARVRPMGISGGPEIAAPLFEPLGYEVDLTPLGSPANAPRPLFDLRLKGTVRLSALLNHLYVLIPVLDNAKHYWVDRDEVDHLLSKGEGWLAAHPEQKLIAKRALKHRRSLQRLALDRLSETAGPEDNENQDEEQGAQRAEESIEKPLRLHDLRLATVVEVLKELGARSILDLGCGEGKLLRRLVKDRGFDRILGVDPSSHCLERASDKLYLKQAGDARRQRLSLQMGSLTYGDRRWQGFDAVTLVEVIEHIDPPRLSAMEASLFGMTRPPFVVITTPNRDYNVLFEKLPEGALRHPDHRFEWTREEFQSWAARTAGAYGYDVEIRPVGERHEERGAPSQMAIFRLATPEAAVS